MPLKLLHHKSWHVWKRENIAKVKRDEAKHEAEEREKKRKQRAVEGERRLKRLKNDQSAGDSRKESNEHINFFEDEEAKGGRATNKDFEAEAKRKKDREMRKMGIAPLGLGETAQKEEFKPWYNMAPEDSAKVVKGAFGKTILGRKGEERRERDVARRQSDDPLLMMNRYVEQTKAVTEREEDVQVVERHRKSSRHKRGKKKKKHKKKEKKKRKH